MSFDLDSYLGIHTQALGLRTQRMTVLAENLANADTPNYKAREVDFRNALAQAAGKLNATAPALDGNTVESDVELAAIGENALQYQATLTFLGGKLATLKSAITGE